MQNQKAFAILAPRRKQHQLLPLTEQASREDAAPASLPATLVGVLPGSTRIMMAAPSAKKSRAFSGFRASVQPPSTDVAKRLFSKLKGSPRRWRSSPSPAAPRAERTARLPSCHASHGRPWWCWIGGRLGAKDEEEDFVILFGFSTTPLSWDSCVVGEKNAVQVMEAPLPPVPNFIAIILVKARPLACSSRVCGHDSL